MSALNKTIIPDFSLPSDIFIRPDILQSLPDILQPLGSRIIMISTAEDFETYYEKALQISSALKGAGLGCIIYDELPKNPTTEDIDQAVSFAKKTNCNIILAFGGIEAVNAAKAIAILANNYLFCDDIFAEPSLQNPPIPIVTVPAYPIFGFEVAPMFFLDEIRNSTKKVYFDKRLYPKVTAVDPSLSPMAEESVLMRAGIATLAISAESVISKANNDIINTFSLKSIDLIFRNLLTIYREPENISANAYLSTASVMSGIAFSVAYLSVTLSLALGLAARGGIDVMSGMGIILPHIMEFNLTSSPGKYVQMSKVMGENVKDITVIEAAIKAVEAIRKIEFDVDIPQRLSSVGIQKSNFKSISNIAAGYPFTENAPRPINTDELETILIAAH